MLSERVADGGERKASGAISETPIGEVRTIDRGNWTKRLGGGGVPICSGFQQRRMHHQSSLRVLVTLTIHIVSTIAIYCHSLTFHPSLHPHRLYPQSLSSSTVLILVPTICFRAESPLSPRTKPTAIPRCNSTSRPPVLQ